MSGVPIVVDRHGGEEPGRRELLALHGLRRSLERFALARVPARSPRVALTSRARLIRNLRELIAALDRRVPHVERAGEALIAQDAAALKAKALKRIAELEAKESSGESRSRGAATRP